jgi:hypothetical protein
LPQITLGRFAARGGYEVVLPGLDVDLGHLATRRSIDQYVLIAKDDLIGSNVVACVCLGSREMDPVSWSSTLP